MIPHALFVGTIGEGVFKSGDSGQTFRRACDGMDFVECYVRALTCSATTNRLVVGTEAGVWESGDPLRSD